MKVDIISFFNHLLADPCQYLFFRRALIGCAVIGFTNGFLSSIVVLRRLALLADALSHSLLPGLAIGAIFFGLAPIGLFTGALIAALCVGIGGHMISRSSRLKDETAIGALYTIAFSLGIILLNYARVPVDLHEFLFGNILALSNADLWIAYAVGALTVLTLVMKQRALLLAMFEPSVAKSVGIRVSRLNYLVFALMILAMIASFQAVGVVLSVGLLVLPGATMYVLCDSYPRIQWGGGVLGAGGACLGLYISHWADLPSGPAIVLVMGVLFILAYVLGPKYGLLSSRWMKKRHFHKESLTRWEGGKPLVGASADIE